jgi:hypothetical protein
VRSGVCGMAVVFLGCAGVSRQHPAPAQDVVTAAEISAARVSTAYEALQSLRPVWLYAARERLPFSVPGQPTPDFDRRCVWTVYIGDRGSTQDALRDTPASRVREIRLIGGGARRPDGSRCDRDSSAIHVLLIDQTPGDAA